MIDPEFYSVKELAVVLAVNEATIRRAIKRGWIQAFQMGAGRRSPWRISKKYIEKLHIASILRGVTITPHGDNQIRPL